LSVFILKKRFGSREPLDFHVLPFVPQKQFCRSAFAPEELQEEERTLRLAGAKQVLVQHRARQMFWLSENMMLAELVTQLQLDPRACLVRAGGTSALPMETTIKLEWTYIEITGKLIGGTEEPFDSLMQKLSKKELAAAANPLITDYITVKLKRGAKGGRGGTTLSLGSNSPGTETSTTVGEELSTQTPRYTRPMYRTFDRAFWPHILQELNGRPHQDNFF
jgi:hypothetical protein